MRTQPCIRAVFTASMVGPDWRACVTGAIRAPGDAAATRSSGDGVSGRMRRPRAQAAGNILPMTDHANCRIRSVLCHPASLTSLAMSGVRSEPDGSLLWPPLRSPPADEGGKLESGERACEVAAFEGLPGFVFVCPVRSGGICRAIDRIEIGSLPTGARASACHRFAVGVVQAAEDRHAMARIPPFQMIGAPRHVLDVWV